MRGVVWMCLPLAGLCLSLWSTPNKTRAEQAQAPARRQISSQEGSAGLALQMMEEARRREKEISVRQEELRAGEERLKELAQQLERAAKELEKKEHELRSLQEKEAGRAKGPHEEKLSQLARLIEGSQPEQGAKILAGIDPATAAKVLSKMNPRKAGRFLSNMPSESAVRVSQALLENRK